MEIANQLDEGIIRYSLFNKWLQNKQEAMKQYFPADADNSHMVNKWMAMGSMVAAALEERPLPWWLSDIEPADISEYRIIEDLDGVKMRGTLDKFMHRDNTIVDNKSLKRKMTGKEEERLKSQLFFTLPDFTSLKNNFEEKDVINYKQQLTFYQVLVAKRHGSVNPVSEIEIIPVMEDSNGLIRRTGEPAVHIPITVTQAERDAMLAQMIKVGKEILICFSAYKKGDIKL